MNEAWLEIGLVLAAVLLPTLPVSVLLARALGRGRGGSHEVETGRSPSTPLTLISVVSVAIAAAALLAVGATLLARSLVA